MNGIGSFGRTARISMRRGEKIGSISTRGETCELDRVGRRGPSAVGGVALWWALTILEVCQPWSMGDSEERRPMIPPRSTNKRCP